MEAKKLIADLRNHFIGSLRFETDEEFRRQMAGLVKRSLTLVGVLGPIALGIFLFGQIVVLNKEPSLSYVGQVPQLVTVLWDKLAMLAVFVALLASRPFLPEDHPGPGRAAMTLAAAVVVVAITLDDVAALNVTFTPAYVTLVVLVFASAVPMHPVSLMAASGFIVGAWYLSVTVLPGVISLPRPVINGEQVVFLIMIAVVSTGASSLLYNVRHEEFQARKNAEDLSHDLAATNRSLEAAIRDLRSAQDRLIHSEKMASLGRFAAGVAHELRNPLNFVTNFARLSVELLEDAEKSPETRDPDAEILQENLSRILGHAARAENIVKSLISHTQHRSSEPSEADINRLVSDQVSLLARRYDLDAASPVARVDLELDEQVGRLRVLATELTVAFASILDNAFLAVIDRAATGETGYEPRIEVKTARDGDRVLIEIRDNGVGMTDGEAEKIFEPFYTTRTTGTGSGLGLASAYAAIAEAHGGSIEVTSDPGVGSTFVVRIGDVRSDQQD